MQDDAMNDTEIRYNLTDVEVDDIASTVAGHWAKKIPSTRSGETRESAYSYADMYQDAAMHALATQRLWDPNKSDLSLVRYCYVAAEREIRHLATRAMAPASSRGRSSMRGGQRTCLTTELASTRKVSIHGEGHRDETAGRHLVTALDYVVRKHVDALAVADGEATLERQQLRRLFEQRAEAVLADDANAMRVLPAVCGLCDPRDLVSDDLPIRAVYSATQRARRKLRQDPVLARAVSELAPPEDAAQCQPLAA